MVWLYLQELGVDLELRYGPSLLLGGLPALLDALEEVVDGAGDDAQLLVWNVDVKARPHGVGLPRTRLQEEEKNERKNYRLPPAAPRKYNTCEL